MSDRSELVEAGAAALTISQWHVEGYHRVTAAKVIEAVEPLLRSRLREQVEALRLMSDVDHDYEDGYESAKRDVLDLLQDGR